SGGRADTAGDRSFRPAAAAANPAGGHGPQPHCLDAATDAGVAAMRVRIGCAVVTAAALLVGCASVPEPRPEARAGKPAVTDQQAGRFFDRYDDVNNEANAARDADAIAAVDTGALLETTATGIRHAEASRYDPPEPFYHSTPAADAPP